MPNPNPSPSNRFKKRGEDPEFDKKRDATLKKNRDEGKTRKINRTKLWAETANKYLAQNEEAGLDILNQLDDLLKKDIADRTRMDILKMKAEILGIKAPAAAVQEEERDTESKDVSDVARRLGEMGVEISGLADSGSDGEGK